MRKPIEIGERSFKYKKDALAHYKGILNSYSFGESLNGEDFRDVIVLLEYDYNSYEGEQPVSDSELYKNETPTETEFSIVDIKVSEVQFSTKCFEVFWNDGESQYISYLMMINRHKDNPATTFSRACRRVIQNDLRAVKKAYFDKNSVKGKVKCQETSLDSFWTELVVDHRQPNTFSVIVDRFIEMNGIDISEVSYAIGEDNTLIFNDNTLSEKFRDYHKSKATLRIVRTERNSGRASLARISVQKNDLRII